MFIPKRDLIDGAYYQGMCRNAEYAKWDADKQVFVHWRTKFGTTFLETICHPEDDQVYDVFEPYKQVDKPDFLKEIE